MANTDRTTPNTQATGRTQTGTTTANMPQRRDRMQGGALARRDPFGAFLDRLFEDFGFGQALAPSTRQLTQWVPQVEVFQRGHELVVRADLPGMKKEDVNVEIKDDALVISGERKEEREEEREGLYQTERFYGNFYRVIPLPEGTIADSAKATFKNGVLEITLQAPPKEVNQGRKINIEETK